MTLLLIDRSLKIMRRVSLVTSPTPTFSNYNLLLETMELLTILVSYVPDLASRY